MELIPTQCCGVEEIHDLSSHSTAEETMMGLCDALTYDGYNDREYRHGSSHSGDLIIPGLITFTGVVGYTDVTRANVTYGPNFAAYIKRHKLGQVTCSSISTNRVNHPTHKIRLWVWKPSISGLIKWWKKHGPPVEKEEECKTPAYTMSAYGGRVYDPGW